MGSERGLASHRCPNRSRAPRLRRRRVGEVHRPARYARARRVRPAELRALRALGRRADGRGGDRMTGSVGEIEAQFAARAGRRLDKEEAAEYLGLTVRTLRTRMEAGEIAYLKLGKL